MNPVYTAVVQRDGNRWIGWVEEISGVNAQARTRKKLLEDLRSALKETLEMNRAGHLAGGTELTLRPITRKSDQRNTKGSKQPVTVGKGLLKLAGKADDLPADAARNLDHYLYGHAKR